MLRAVPLIESVEDIESLATEEKADLYEFNQSGETEKNILSHQRLTSYEEREMEEEFGFPATRDVLTAIDGGK